MSIGQVQIPLKSGFPCSLGAVFSLRTAHVFPVVPPKNNDALCYANELLVRVRLSFQKLLLTHLNRNNIQTAVTNMTKQRMFF